MMGEYNLYWRQVLELRRLEAQGGPAGMIRQSDLKVCEMIGSIVGFELRFVRNITVA